MAIGGGSIIGSQAFGFVASLIGTRREKKDYDEFREGELARAEGQRVSLDKAFTEFEEATTRVSGRNLAEAEGFFGGREGALSNILDPAVATSNKLAGEFGDIESEGRALGASVYAGQRASEASLLGGQAGRSEAIIARQRELGEAEIGEIGRTFSNARATQRGRLAGQGLGGTSVGASILGSFTSGQARETGLARERLAGEEISLQERLDADRLGLSERQSALTLQQQAASGEFGLGLARDRIGAEREASEFGLEAGLLGLSEQERALTNLRDIRTQEGLAPAEAGIRKAERMAELELEQIVPLPPVVGRFGRPFALSGVKGKDTV